MDFKKLFIKLRAPLYRIGLKNYTFSIISNNCWGGIVSRDRGIVYNSPTAGLFFFADDYIKFLTNLKYYLSLDMTQISVNQSKYAQVLLKQYDENLIIGVLDDVEVIMLHYKSFEEAKNKWERRKKRINFDNLLVKFSDQNQFEDKHFQQFLQLDYKNKLFITTNPKFASSITCVLKDTQNAGYAKDDIKPSFRVLNINKLLNDLEKK